MKKILFIIGIVLGSSVWAQDAAKLVIIEDMRKSTQSMQEKDPSVFIDQIHPYAYEFTNKEELLKTFKSQAIGTEDYKLNILPVNEDLIEVSNFMDGANGAKYAFVNVPVTMEMTFFKKFDEKYKKALTDKFAAQGITPEFLSDDTVRLTRKSFLVAITDARTKGEWKYLTYEKNSDLMKLAVDPEVLARADRFQSSAAPAKKEGEKKPAAATQKKMLRRN